MIDLPNAYKVFGLTLLHCPYSCLNFVIFISIHIYYTNLLHLRRRNGCYGNMVSSY